MAPEVVTGKQYDASADIWSFGITALELTQGQAPLSRAAPASVLMHIATAPPPKMDRNAGVHTYSAAFADAIAQCLQKDPTKRPSAQDLLKTTFFKSAKKKGYLVGAILEGLPPLVQRQEKRRVPSLMSHHTMESWDFSVREDVIVSPTNSIDSVYSINGHFSRRPRGTLPRDGVPELDDKDDEARWKPSETEQGVGEGAAAYVHRICEHTQVRPQAVAEVDILSSSACFGGDMPPPAPAFATPRERDDAMDLNSATPRQLSSSPALLEKSLDSTPTPTDRSEFITPPLSVTAPQPKLWRRLIGRNASSARGRDKDVGGDAGVVGGAGAGGSFRRKTVGGVSNLVRSVRSGASLSSSPVLSLNANRLCAGKQ